MSGATTLPPLPMRQGTMLLADLVDLYMAHYAGRDSTRVQRLGWWRGQVGQVALQDLSDDHVHVALEALANQASRFFAGQDADGRPIYKAKKKPLAPATVNRYAASLAAVLTWAIKRRIAPKGYVHPCRSIERRPEHNEKTRFLSDDERDRLLQACKASTWPRLYLLVLMALTTGARKGELQGLRWGDIDFERSQATVPRTKNGDPRVLPLVPAVLAELQRFKAGPTVRIFGAARDGSRPYAFEPRFAQALQAARIRGVTFHTLRHSCASMLAQNGATLLEIGDLLGHRQMQMTKRYSHLATGHKAALVNRLLGGIG
ncbi:MAG: site-specific integrase [Burkholderiales bacterium]|nr:site-specific integrase [Burkholderiales bacterium]